MRHRKSGVKLNRTTSHRQAMFRNMVTSLLKHDRIKTTAPKAKELRRWADHLITLAKRGDLHARRQALSIVREKAVVHKLFEEASERFGSRNGGYTRTVKIGRRPGDAAPLTIIELLHADDVKPAKTKKSAGKPEAKPVVSETSQAEQKSMPTESAAEQAESAVDAEDEKQTAKGGAEAEVEPKDEVAETTAERNIEEVAKTPEKPEDQKEANDSEK